MQENNELAVFVSSRESTCSQCNTALLPASWIMLDEKKKVLCLECADLEHLEFLPAGDAALTRRAKKHSGLWAVVLRWSRNRKRYERQGLLVESQAIEQAEQECLDDAEMRERRNIRAAARRKELDAVYVDSFCRKIRELYRAIPGERARSIAEHACMKYSGRVGRTAFAKELDDKAIHLAVAAHIRHSETEYDTLLLRNVPRALARERVLQKVQNVQKVWRGE